MIITLVRVNRFRYSAGRCPTDKQTNQSQTNEQKWTAAKRWLKSCNTLNWNLNLSSLFEKQKPQNTHVTFSNETWVTILKERTTVKLLARLGTGSHAHGTEKTALDTLCASKGLGFTFTDSPPRPRKPQGHDPPPWAAAADRHLPSQGWTLPPTPTPVPTRAGTYRRLPTPDRTTVPRASSAVLPPLRRRQKAAEAAWSNTARTAVRRHGGPSVDCNLTNQQRFEIRERMNNKWWTNKRFLQEQMNI